MNTSATRGTPCRIVVASRVRIAPAVRLTLAAFVFVGVAGAVGCAHPMIRTAEAFRAAVKAGDYDMARVYMSADPRTWYGEREGEGNAWTLGAGRWKTWDTEFSGRSELGPWQIGEQRIFAVAVEDNDYYRLINRDPSPWLLTYFFDDEGRIEGRMVSSVPDELRPPSPENADLGEAFDTWLRQKYPQEYEYLRPGGEIDPTGDRAARTRAKLEEWRAATDRPSLSPGH